MLTFELVFSESLRRKENRVCASCFLKVNDVFVWYDTEHGAGTVGY